MLHQGLCLKSFLFVIVFLSRGISCLTESRPLVESHVTCSRDFIQLDLKLRSPLWRRRPGIQMHLADQSCVPHLRNSTHVSIRSTLYGCGTKLNVTDKHAVFFNRFHAKAKAGKGQSVSYFPDVDVDFRCIYKRKSLTLSPGPLRLDKLHSSPAKVTTFSGLPVPLKCAFKHGVPPVNIVMYHHGKPLAYQQNNTLLVHTAGGQRDDYGVYTCVASDDDQSIVHHNIKLKKINSSTVPTHGLRLTCTQREMRIKLSRVMYPWLQPDYFRMHLVDPKCGPHHVTALHITVKTAYAGCGTVMEKSLYGAAFQNVFMAVLRAPNGTKITRVPDVWFPFRCQYDPTSKTMVPALQEKKILYPTDQAPLVSGSSSSGLANYALYTSGSLVRALCYVSKYERFIGWKDERGRPISQLEGRVRVHGRKLLIDNVSEDDGGVYKCRSASWIVSLEIYVEGKLTAPPVQHILRGSDDVIVCSAAGYPKPYMHWKKEGKLLKTRGRFTVTENGSLLIKNARKSDSGSYGCFAVQTIKVPGEIRRIKNVSVLVIVHESLSVDKSKSSPSVVKTYSGFELRVLCTFQGGAPPVNITLTKRGRGLIRGVQIKGQTLYSTIKTSHWTAFGHYYCIARDSKGNTAKHRFNIVKAGLRDFTSEGVTVNCSSHHINVQINRLNYPWLNSENFDFHLVQSNCTPYNVTDANIQIQVPLHGCGTISVRKNSSVEEFRNAFIARVKPVHGSRTTYLPDTYFPFYCAYEKISPFPGRTQLQPIGPLRVDLSRSSPPAMYYPHNVTTELICVFKGGEPPITISLKRNHVLVSRAQGRMLSLFLKPPDGQRITGHYVCKAADAQNRMASHKISVNVLDYDVISDAGVRVECGSRQTVVTLNRAMFPWLRTKHLHPIQLNDPDCRPSLVNSTHVLFKIPPGSCGSRHVSTSRSLVFSNRVLIFDTKKAGKEAYQKTIFEFPFQCRYRRITSVTEKLK